MNKKELEDRCKALREALDAAHLEVAELKKNNQNNDDSSFSDVAVGGYFDNEKKEWMLSELSFNRETGKAVVIEQKSVGKDFALFNYYLNKFVSEKINMRSFK